MKCKILEIECPKKGYARELLRVPRNEIHGEVVMTLHDDGRMWLYIFANGIDNVPHKTHEVELEHSQVVLKELGANSP